MAEIDFDVREFANLLASLPEHMPISFAMENADPQKQGRWWDSQQEHMVSWFSAQATHGEGAFTRGEKNFSAKKTYNRLQCPEGLVWIAEALGADTELLEQVAQDALEVSRRSRSAYVRKHVPWAMVAELAQQQIGER